MNSTMLFGMCAVIWLASMIACVVAVRLARRVDQGWTWTPAFLSVSALAIGYLGLTRFRLEASETVNGVMRWHFDSRWLFVVTLVVGTCVAGYCLWRQRRSIRVA